MVGIGSAMIDDDRSTDDYQQQRLACVSRTASRVGWIGSSRMDRVESVGSSRVESRICMHASVHPHLIGLERGVVSGSEC
jgi:hypothetical protein